MVGYFSASLDPTQPDSYEARERKRRLAEALIQQGSSTAPVQHWTQGLARLAQALAGTLDERRLDDQEAASNKTAMDAILGAYEAGGSTPAPGGTTPSLGPVASDGQPAPTPPADIHNPGPGPLSDAIRTASAKFGIDPAYLTRTAQIESNYGQNLQSPLSSAGGPFAFTDATARQYGLANKNDPMASAEAAARLALDNKAALAAALKRDPTPAELYLAHQQGAGGASALLANPNASAVDALTSIYGSRAAALKAIQNNGGRPDMTAGDFAAKWLTKFGAAPNAVAAINQAAPQQIASNAPGLGYAPASGGASLSGQMPAPADELTVRALQDYARRKNLQPPSPEMLPNTPPPNPAGGASLVNPDEPAPGAVIAGPAPSPLRDTGDGSLNNPFLEGSPEAQAAMQRSALSTAGEQPGPKAYAPAGSGTVRDSIDRAFSKISQPGAPPANSPSPARATTPTGSGISDRSKQMLMIALNPQFSPAQRQVAASAFATMQAQDKPMVLQEGATLIKPDGKGGYMTVAGGGPKQSDAIRNYEYYASQERQAGRQPKPMDQWQIDQKRAGATTISIDQKGQGAMQQKAIDAFDTAVKAGADANRRITAYGQLAQAMQGFTPGATAEARVKAKSILKDMGIIEGADVPDAEAFKRVQRQLEIAATPKGQGQITENERVLIRDLIPQIGNSPEGVAKIVQQLKQLDDYDLKVAQIYRDNARKNGGVPNYLEVSDEIANLGPPMTDAQVAALKSLTSTKPPAPTSGAPAPSSAPRWRIVQ